MTFARRQPRPDRSAEFASYAPRAQPTAPASGVLAAAMAMPKLAPESGPSDAAGRRHMARVAALGCVLCKRLGYGHSAAEVHHLRAGIGKAQRASHWLTMPLCADHHRGAHGVHGTRIALGIAGVTELDLLADTIASIVGD